MKKVAVILERVYKFYTERLHLRMLSPCDQERYLVYYYVGLSQGAVIEINDRCVAYISVTNRYRWFLPLELAHELAHAVNHYYHPDIPGWIDESLANALAYYFLNTTWKDIANAFINDMCTYVQGGTWIPGVPYKWWPFFYYLILKYGAVKVEKESTNITWLRQNWLPFIEHMILFKQTAKCLEPIKVRVIERFNRRIIVSPYWSPTVLEIYSPRTIAIKVKVACRERIIIYPNDTLLVTPQHSAVILLAVPIKHFEECDLTIRKMKINSTVLVELDGRLVTLENACKQKLLDYKICEQIIRNERINNKEERSIFKKILFILRLVFHLLEILGFPIPNFVAYTLPC